MDKLASPAQLVSELRTLLAYAESPNPSRAKLASGLESLANRTAKAPQLPGSKEIDEAISLLIKGLTLSFPTVSKSEIREEANSAVDLAVRQSRKNQAGLGKLDR